MKIQRLIVHCSDSPDNLDIGVAEIRAWHTMAPPQGRGWRDVGYHYVVRRDGTVEVGRYENGDSVLEGKEIGAHVQGHNADTLGICWVGRDRIEPVQRAALLKLLRHLMTLHGIAPMNVLGHGELNPGKSCPRLDMVGVRKALEAMAA